MFVHKQGTQMPPQITNKDIKKQIKIEYQKDTQMLSLGTVKKFKYFHFGKNCNFCAINMMTNSRM